jgi:hypothetical protein
MHTHPGAFTVDEWCLHRRISRWKLYDMWKRNVGPRFYFNGSRRLISAEADSDWVREQEEQAVTPEAKAAIERARERARDRIVGRESGGEAA